MFFTDLLVKVTHSHSVVVMPNIVLGLKMTSFHQPSEKINNLHKNRTFMRFISATNESCILETSKACASMVESLNLSIRDSISLSNLFLSS